jgi:hypothetical protein
MKRIWVDVTQEDLDKGVKADSKNCAVARAIARAIPNATHIEVDTQTIRYTVDGIRYQHLTPATSQVYVTAFDAGDTEDFNPWRFQLRDPKVTRRRIRTEKGKVAMRATNYRRRGRPDVPIPPSTSGPSQVTTAGEVNPAPRVFKKKQRMYGGRLLRINKEGSPGWRALLADE